MTSRSILTVLLLIPMTAAAEYPHPPSRVSLGRNLLTQQRENSSDDELYLFKTDGRSVAVKAWLGNDAIGFWTTWQPFAQNEMAGPTDFGTSLAAYGGELFSIRDQAFHPRFGALVNFRAP